MHPSAGWRETGVAWDLVMDLVEMQMEDPGFYDVARILGVSTATISRYKKEGLVPRDVAESLYDRIANGLGPRKPKHTTFEYPMDYDERAELGRVHAYKYLERVRSASAADQVPKIA